MAAAIHAFRRRRFINTLLDGQSYRFALSLENHETGQLEPLAGSLEELIGQ
jgi:hypothetical protein